MNIIKFISQHNNKKLKKLLVIAKISNGYKII